MKIAIISDIMEEVPENTRDFTRVTSTMAGKQPKVIPGSYTMYYIAGTIYNIWWHSGLDFKRLTLDAGGLYDDQAPAVIFKFNYTLNRELYDITDRSGRIAPGALKNVTDAPDIDTC